MDDIREQVKLEGWGSTIPNGQQNQTGVKVLKQVLANLQNILDRMVVSQKTEPGWKLPLYTAMRIGDNYNICEFVTLQICQKVKF